MLRIDIINKPARKNKSFNKITYATFQKKYKRAETHRDIIRSSNKIKNLLLVRFKELDLTHKGVIKDAKLRGINLHPAGFSRYFSDTFNDKNMLTQFQILWLMIRYGISISFNIKKLDYNERQCLQRIEQLNQYK